MLTVPQPQVNFRGNYASFPAQTLKPPVEGNRTVPAEIFWTRDAVSPTYTIAFNLRSQQVLSLSQICALHVDNTACSSTVNILFPDTHFQLALDPGLEGFYPVITSGLEFFAWVSVAPTASEHTVIQILNFLPPPMEFGAGSGGGGVGVGTVRTVATGPGLTGGPITDTGTVSLITPVAISNGGTSGTTAAAALDNLSGASGATAGSLSRSAGGAWSVNPAGSGTMTQVIAGNGLSGGTITTTGTIALIAPVSIANGGTGATTAANALTQLGAAPVNNPVLTGDPRSVTPPPGDNDTSIATTAFVANALGTAGFGTISAVVAGNGLAGGGTSGSVTVGIAAPVSVANGGTGATDAAAALTNLGGFPLTGGTVTGPAFFTGPAAQVAIQPSSPAWAQLTLSSQTGQRNRILGSKGALAHWEVYLGQGDAADDFGISNYNDSGVFVSTPLTIYRATGVLRTMSGTFEVGTGGTGSAVTSTFNGTRNYQTGTLLTDCWGVFDVNAGAVRLQVTTTGACWNQTGTWAAMSDERTKDAASIQPYTRGLAELLELDPVSFQYNGRYGTVADGQTHYGLVAQQVEPVIPEIVLERDYVDRDAAGAPQQDAEPVTLKGVDSGRLMFSVINALKEVSARLEAAEASLATLVPPPAGGA